MRENFDRCLAWLLESEGGFSNHADDPGGATNLGVTLVAWGKWSGKPATEADIRALTPAAVSPFYKQAYWDRAKCDDLPSGVDYAVFDFAVNSGVNRAIRYAQSIVDVPQDGMFGPVTLAAIKATDPKWFVQRFCSARQRYLEGLPTFRTFGRGWTKRVQTVAARAAEMAA
jgi:lysozyme family protein